MTIGTKKSASVSTKPASLRLRLFGSLMVLPVLLVLENYVFYVAEWGKAPVASALFLWKLPFLFLQSAIVAAAAASIGPYIQRHRWAYIPYLATLMAVQVFVALDQIYYKLFTDHVNMAASEDAVTGVGNLWGSFIAETDYLTVINLLVVVAVTFVQFRMLRHDCSSSMFDRLSPHFSWRGRVVLASWVLGSLLVSKYAETHELEGHPLFTIWRTMRGEDSGQDNVELVDDYLTPQWGSFSEDPAIAAKLIDYRDKLRQLKSPNIVFVVLESVGSLQLFPGGKPDAETTPFLASMTPKAAFFDTVYTSFPSTARTHVPMLTGGPTITWGSVFKDMSFKYIGPTLISQLLNQGYQPALYSSGDLNYENRYGFYKNLGYETIVGYNTLEPLERVKNRMSSWGVTEDYAWSKAVNWLDHERDPSKPFLMHYMTVCTHHPYEIPNGGKIDIKGFGRLGAYKRALTYTDGLLKKIYDDLQSRGLADNTIIAVIGDHGEAFGDLHKGNMTHKNFIYEENVRTFLWVLAPPSLDVEGVQTARIGTVGDVMPTILNMTSETLPDVPGQSLWAADWKLRQVYFHKSARPDKWGLRDGKWKFIAEIRGDSRELYDLELDPTEQRNLADSYPDRIERYTAMTTTWYVRTNEIFRSKLENYVALGGRSLSARDFRTPGPKLLAFGLRADKGDFVEHKEFTADQPVKVWVQYVPYGADTNLLYRWRSPDGQTYDQPAPINGEWMDTYFPIPAPQPLAKGDWQFEVKEAGKTLLTGKFAVR